MVQLQPNKFGKLQLAVQEKIFASCQMHQKTLQWRKPAFGLNTWRESDALFTDGGIRELVTVNHSHCAP